MDEKDTIMERPNMRIKLITAILVLAVAPGLASGQEADARLRATLDAAQEAGIPTELLESKIREGQAKGIPQARIAAAVETRLQALMRARSAIGEQAGQVQSGELSLAADALQAGASEAAVAAVMARAPRERRAVATAVLTQLVELGVGSDVALERIQAALAQGGGALVNLPAQASGRARGRAGDRGGVRVGPPDEVDAGVRGGRDRGPDDRPGRDGNTGRGPSASL